MHPHIAWLNDRFARNEHTRVVAFGSSNTERRLPGMHWFDCLDLAIQQQYGRPHRFLGMGIGGETTRELLARFDRDLAFYQPHAVIVTIGGNDCNPEHAMSAEEFEANLIELNKRFNELDARVIYQTYYALDSDGTARFTNYEIFADVIRRVAETTDSVLVDHFKRWTPLRLQHPDIYRPLMDDAMHVNWRGNQVMGADLARLFGLTLNATDDYWDETHAIQKLMDQLEG